VVDNIDNTVVFFYYLTSEAEGDACCFSLFSEIGEPFVPIFNRIIEDNNLTLRTEGEDDIYTVLIDSLKEQRNDIKTQIKEFRDIRSTDRNLPEVESTLGFNGITSGWVEIGGKAYPTTLSLDGKAGQVGERGWNLFGTGIAQVGERTVTFDLNGFAKKNHIGIKGVSIDNESIVIHLRGHFAPIAGDDGSYALAFKGAIANTASDIIVPLVLVGDVQTFPLDSTVDESKLVEPEISDSEIEDLLDDLL